MNTSNKNEVTGARKAVRKWKDTPASTAEQIEIAMRKGNNDKRAGLNAIIAQCMAIRDMSDNQPMREFAEIIEGIARQALIQ